MLIDAARQTFNMQDITNRRFMYDPNTCALILGDQEAMKGLSFGSHAEDHGDSGAKVPFDSFVRGWVGTGEAYKHGVIHFAPPINGKNAGRLIDGYNTLQMFRENGAVADTVVRGFPGAWEQPLSAILPGFANTKEKESEDRDMEYYGPYYGVWAVRGGGSVLGPAEAWSKYNEIPLVFTHKDAAERQAAQYNENTASRNVHYYAKEMEPMIARDALKEQEVTIADRVEDKTPARRKSATAKLEAAKQTVKPPAPKAPGKKTELDRG